MHKAIVLRAWILFLRRDIAGPFLEQVSSRLRGTCSRFSRPHQLLAPASQGPCFPPNHPRTHPAPGPNKCLSFQPSLLLKPHPWSSHLLEPCHSLAFRQEALWSPCREGVSVLPTSSWGWWLGQRWAPISAPVSTGVWVGSLLTATMGLQAP